jgi:hypothetical protein
MAIPPVAAYAVEFTRRIDVISEQQIFSLSGQIDSIGADNQSLNREMDEIEESGRRPEFREECANYLSEQSSKCDEYVKGFRRAFALSKNVEKIFARFHKIKGEIDLIEFNARARIGLELFLLRTHPDFAFIYDRLNRTVSRTSGVASRYFYRLKLFFQNLDSAIERFNRIDPNISFCAKWFNAWRWHNWPNSFFSLFKHPNSYVGSQFCFADYPNLAKVLDCSGYTETREANAFFPRDLMDQSRIILASFNQICRRSEAIRP